MNKFSNIQHSVTDEGLALFETMMQETSKKTDVLAKILPQMATPAEAKQLLAGALNYNKSEVLQLRRKLRYALKPILGDPNGYYVLDLSDDMDRLCVGRLMEISKTAARNKSEISKIGFGLVGDLSQRGNWSCFRNEIYNGAPFVMTLAFANSMPHHGSLEFDFSAGSRPPKDCMCISDSRFIQVLINHFLLPSELRITAQNRLNLQRKMGDLSIECDGHTMYQISLRKAQLIGQHVDTFLLNITQRSTQHNETVQNEKTGSCLDMEKPALLNPRVEYSLDSVIDENNSCGGIGFSDSVLDSTTARFSLIIL